MSTKIFVLLSFCILTVFACSRTEGIAKEAFNSWRHYTKGKIKSIVHKDMLPWENYWYRANTADLTQIKLIYPKKKSYEFYIVDDKLVQILIIDITKGRYLDAYFFKNDSLAGKYGDYKDSLDLPKLQEVFVKYKAKATTEILADNN